MLLTVRPRISVDARKQTSVTFKTYPSPLQNNGFQVVGIQYARREVPQGNGNISNRRERWDEGEFVSLKGWTSGGAASNLEQQATVKKLKPGMKYAMKLRAEYNTGDFMESDEIAFETLAYTGKIIVQFIMYI